MVEKLRFGQLKNLSYVAVSSHAGHSLNPCLALTRWTPYGGDWWKFAWIATLSCVFKNIRVVRWPLNFALTITPDSLPQKRFWDVRQVSGCDLAIVPGSGAALTEVTIACIMYPQKNCVCRRNTDPCIPWNTWVDDYLFASSAPSKLCFLLSPCCCY